MAETLRADGIAANNGCLLPTNAQGAPDGIWTSNTGNTNWDCRWTVGNPTLPLTVGYTEHTAGVLVRRELAGGSDPTCAVELWSGGTLVRELVAATVVTSTSGQTLSGTFTTAEAGPGNSLEVRAVVVGGGGSPTNRRNAQVDAVTVTVDTSVAGVAGTVSVTETDDAVTSAGAVTPPPVTGTIAATETADTVSAAGTYVAPGVAGTVTVTEGPDSLTAAGTSAAPGNSGTSTWTEADDVATATGTVTIAGATGTVAFTEQSDTASATGTTGTPTFTGTVAYVEQDDTAAATGQTDGPGVAGTVTFTEAADGLVGTATFTGLFAGTVTITEQSDAAAGNGVVTTVLGAMVPARSAARVEPRGKSTVVRAVKADVVATHAPAAVSSSTVNGA